MKSIHEMHQMVARDAGQEPIVVTYNDSVSISNLEAIERTQAAGSTDFVKGNQTM